ncbi:MAG: ATP-binding protein [Treponema sp.]|nr:ATP-binding protein [Treponema sp.]
MENIKTMNEYKIPQFTLITTPEQEELVRQREAEAERERELELLAKKKQEFENSGVPKRYWNESFDTWKTRNKDDEVRLQTVIDFSRQESNDSVLLLLGPKGVGKTHLGASIIREVGGSFISVDEMIFKYECSMDFHSETNRVNLMNFYSTTPMLVIDEIGRSMQQAKEDAILNYILRRRYENMLPTVLISNLKKEDLLKKLGDAVVDRLTETCKSVEFVGESYRLGKRKIA